MKEIGLINVDSFNREVMTSKEIAELTGKNHADVMRDIRNILSQLPENQQESNFALVYYKQNLPNGGCKEQPMYELSKKGCLCLASGYRADLRMTIINRWEELELKNKQNVPALPTTYKEALKQLLVQVEENERLQLENKQQQQIITEYEPKVTYHDLILQTPDVLSVSQISKDYGKSAVWMNKKLEELGVQYKQGGVWLLYQKYAELGLTKSKTSVYHDSDGIEHSTLHTYWTQKGRLFIYDLLKQNGELPLIEK